MIRLFFFVIFTSFRVTLSFALVHAGGCPKVTTSRKTKYFDSSVYVCACIFGFFLFLSLVSSVLFYFVRAFYFDICDGVSSKTKLQICVLLKVFLFLPFFFFLLLLLSSSSCFLGQRKTNEHLDRSFSHSINQKRHVSFLRFLISLPSEKKRHKHRIRHERIS